MSGDSCTLQHPDEKESLVGSEPPEAVSGPISSGRAYLADPFWVLGQEHLESM